MYNFNLYNLLDCLSFGNDGNLVLFYPDEVDTKNATSNSLNKQ
jgi:hypothetical protein